MSIELSKSLDYVMLPLRYIARLNWDKNLGKSLKTLRGKLSRRQLAENLKAKGVQCSHQYIQNIEDATVETVDLLLILEICKELNISIRQLLPAVYLEMPEKFSEHT